MTKLDLSTDHLQQVLAGTRDPVAPATEPLPAARMVAIKKIMATATERLNEDDRKP